MQVSREIPEVSWWSRPRVCPISWQITVLHFGRVVVPIARVAKVEVVVLDHALHDVHAASNPDLGKPKPAGVPVAGAADLNTSQCRPAPPRAGTPGYDLRIQDCGIRPVTRRCHKHGIPEHTHVVAELEAEWVVRARPVISVPRVV